MITKRLAGRRAGCVPLHRVHLDLEGMDVKERYRIAQHVIEARYSRQRQKIASNLSATLKWKMSEVLWFIKRLGFTSFVPLKN